MNTKMQFDMMTKAMPYAAELLECEGVQNFKKGVKDSKYVSNSEMFSALMPVFLMEKREAVFGLLGAISGKTAEEIAEQDWEETRKLMDSPIINDVFDFFIFSVRMARNA